MQTIKLLGDRVLLKEDTKKEDRRTSSGIIIPETATVDDVRYGVVIAVGPGIYTQSGTLIPMHVKVNDRVIIPPYGNGQILKLDNQEYVVYREADLIGMVSNNTELIADSNDTFYTVI